MQARFEAPNDGELRWIRENVAMATTLARKYGGDPPESDLPSLAALDVVWVELTEALRAKKGNPNKVVNLVGLALGEILVRRLGLAWTVVKDEHGTDIALHGQPGDVVVFPTNLVAKRWARGEGAFLEQLFDAMRIDIERARAR